MDALVKATRQVLESSGVDGQSVSAIALDTTGSSVVPVDAQMQPLDDYYLWCDHRALHEAQQITALLDNYQHAVSAVKAAALVK